MTNPNEDPPIETEAEGAGVMPAGTGPAGLYTQATAGASPEVSAGSRYLDPVTRDYIITDTTDQQAQMPAARQRVLIALMTVRGTSTAKPGLGLRTPRKMGGRFVQEMQGSVRSALAHLTRDDAPVIKLQRIDVQVPRGGRAVVTVSFIDLSTGREDRASSNV